MVACALAIPQHIINVIRALYHNNTHAITIGRYTFPELVINVGVRQGCPLSADLFTLALAPFG